MSVVVGDIECFPERISCRKKGGEEDCCEGMMHFGRCRVCVVVSTVIEWKGKRQKYRHVHQSSI